MKSFLYILYYSYRRGGDFRNSGVSFGVFFHALERNAENKESLEPVGAQGFSWSCWADLNRRPHPYQKYNVCFAGYPFVPFCARKSLHRKPFPVSGSYPVFPGFARFVGRLLETLRAQRPPWYRIPHPRTLFKISISISC